MIFALLLLNDYKLFRMANYHLHAYDNPSEFYYS